MAIFSRFVKNIKLCFWCLESTSPKGLYCRIFVMMMQANGLCWSHIIPFDSKNKNESRLAFSLCPFTYCKKCYFQILCFSFLLVISLIANDTRLKIIQQCAYFWANKIVLKSVFFRSEESGLEFKWFPAKKQAFNW